MAERVPAARVSVSAKSARRSPPEINDDLKECERPRDAMSACLTKLASDDWETLMQGLVLMVRLLRFHPDITMQHVQHLCVGVHQGINNLRTQVASLACQAALDLFKTFKDARRFETICDSVVDSLFQRCADTNAFIREQAVIALTAMSTHCSIKKVLNLIVMKGARHQNPATRTAAARVLRDLVQRIGAEKVFSLSRESRRKVICTSAQFLTAATPDTRECGKEIFRLLSSFGDYETQLLELIPISDYRRVENTLQSVFD